jgi:hypothetical protein
MATRQPKRNETHALVGCVDMIRVRELNCGIWEIDKINFRKATLIAACEPGHKDPCTPWGLPLRKEDIAKALQRIAGFDFADADAYAKVRAEARLADHVMRHGDVAVSEPLVLQWSRSSANAEKAKAIWRRRGYVNLLVVRASDIALVPYDGSWFSGAFMNYVDKSID